jgi:hypothetical protein
MTTFTRGHLSTRSARNGSPTHQVDRAVGEAQDHTVTRTGIDSGEALRGIPAIGRNVAGAIPGTSPHALRR